MNTRKTSQDFTLIELMVVIVIIAILAALLLPALSKAKFQAKLAVCTSNLKEIGIGALSYAGDNSMYYPGSDYDASHPPGATFVGRRLPYEAESTAAGIWGSYMGYNDQKCNWKVPLFQCPQGTTEAWWFKSNKSASGARNTAHSGWAGFYNLYFDLYGGTDNRLGDKSKMRRVGDSFTTAGAKKEYRIMASDYCKVARIAHASNRTAGWMTNHIWGGERNWSWDDPGAAHFSYPPLYFSSTTGIAYTNWMRDDGSVARVGPDNIGRKALYTKATSPGSGEAFSIPIDLAEN